MQNDIIIFECYVGLDLQNGFQLFGWSVGLYMHEIAALQHYKTTAEINVSRDKLCNNQVAIKISRFEAAVLPRPGGRGDPQRPKESARAGKL